MMPTTTDLPHKHRKRPDVTLAIALGYLFDRWTGSGHLAFVHPCNGARVILSNTPSDGRAVLNAMSQLRRNQR